LQPDFCPARLPHCWQWRHGHLSFRSVDRRDVAIEPRAGLPLERELYSQDGIHAGTRPGTRGHEAEPRGPVRHRSCFWILMKTMFHLLLLVAIASQANAGTIYGTVRAQGKAAAQSDAGGGAYASRKYKFAERVNYDDLKDFLVYIDGPMGTNKTAPPSQPV